MANDACDEPSLELLSLLKNSFTTAEALDAGRQLKVTERTVMNYLKEQPLKAQSPILVTLSGITTSVTKLHNINA